MPNLAKRPDLMASTGTVWCSAAPTHRCGELSGNDDSKAETLGLLVAYVDDLLLLMPNGSMKRGLIDHLRTLWNMSTEVDLTDQQKLTFLGLELERTPTGALLVHQRAVIEHS